MKAFSSGGKILLEGTHLMLDCFGCDKNALGESETISRFLAALPTALGMKKLIEPYIVCYPGGDTWDKGGITGFMLIAESHISIHTFPDDGFFTADVYSCKPFDVQKAVALFKETFRYTREKIKMVKRDIEVVRDKNLAEMALARAK
ncbi:S-adenosylmethionine decarboxylase proenzyme [uncultured archaeon]|nr:S-adenosylmethionine decarboxylase proenzyme [uncultured archaeon]